MARDIVKLGLAVAALVIAGALVALFAAGYISAFKPGGAKDAGRTTSYSGGTVAGGGYTYSPPSPSPAPAPATVPGDSAGPPQQADRMPQSAYLGPTLMAPINTPPLAPPPAIRGAPPGALPQRSWFDEGAVKGRPTKKASPSPVPSGLMWEQQPRLTPYEAGWQQVIQKLISLLPFIFSRQCPVIPWWTLAF